MALRLLIGLVLGLPVLLGIGAGVLAWRLAGGPIQLPFLSARIAAALGSAGDSLTVSVGATELAWDGAERDLELRAKDLRFAVRGEPRASFPAVGLRLSPLALLRGEIVPTGIELDRPDLRLAILPDGSIDLGVPTKGDATLPAHPGGAPPEPATAGSVPLPPAITQLRRIEIQGGRLSLVPPAETPPLELEGFDLDLRRDGDRLSLRFTTTLLREEDRIPLSGDGEYDLDREVGSLDASFQSLAPRVLSGLLAATTLRAQQSEPGAAILLQGIRLPLSGSIRLALKDHLPHRVEVDLEGGAGSIEAPGLPDLQIERLRLAVLADLVVGQLGLLDLTLELGGPILQVEATIGDLTGDAAFDGTATLATLPVDTLSSYWPADAATAARRWITSNLRGGRVRYARVRLSGRLDDPSSEDHVVLDPPTGWLTFDGLSVRYLGSMPKVQNVAGQGAFSAAGWKLVVLDGTTEGVEIRQARVGIATPERGPVRLSVRASVAGALDRTVSLLEREPVRLAQQLGFDPQVEGGRVAGRLDLALPLGGRGARTSIAAIARARDVALARIVRGASVGDGELRVRLAHDSLHLRGKGLLAGAPIRLDWREPTSGGAGAERRVELSGRLDDAAREALGVDTRPVLSGPVELRADWRQPAKGDGRIDVTLGLDEAVLDVPPIAVKKTAGAAGSASARLTMHGAVLAAIDDLVLETPGARATGRATFVPGASEVRSLELRTVIRQSADKSAELRLEARPEGSESRVALRCDDASVWLEAIDAASDWSGGKLDVTGTARLALDAFRFDGRLEARDVTLDHSPLVTRIISLTSISGLERALRGKPIRFDQVASGLTIDPASLTIRGGAASGSSLRILMDGTIDRRTDTAQLEGTLIPSYYGVNEAAQHIPVLGRLLGGEDNAILTIGFSMTGPLADPKVSVKPLSSAAPGFLRDLVKRLGPGA